MEETKRTIKKPSVTGASKTKVKSAKAVKEEVAVVPFEDMKVFANGEQIDPINGIEQPKEIIVTQEPQLENEPQVNAVEEIKNDNVKGVEEMENVQEINNEMEIVNEPVVETNNGTGIIPRSVFMALTKKEKIKLMTQYRKDFTAKTIKNEMGLSEANYYNILKDLDLPMARPTKKRNDENGQQRQTVSKPQSQSNVSTTMNIALTFSDICLGSDVMERINSLMTFVDQNSEYEFKIELVKK